MTLRIPDFPEWLVVSLMGPWPPGDEDGIRSHGDGWSRVGDTLGELASQHNTATITLAAAFTGGRTATAMIDHQHQLAQNITDQVAYCDSMARQCYETANSLEMAKLVAIGTAAILLLQLTIDAAMFYAGGGFKALHDRLTAEAAIKNAIRTAGLDIAKTGATAATRRLAWKGAAHATLVGAVLGGGVNATAQAYQTLQGHRHEFDTASFLEQTLGGAVGGAIGAETGRRLAPGIDRITEQIGRKLVSTQHKTVSAVAQVGVHIGATMLLGAAGGVTGGIGGALATTLATSSPLTLDNLLSTTIAGFGGGFLGAAGNSLRTSPPFKHPTTPPPTHPTGPPPTTTPKAQHHTGPPTTTKHPAGPPATVTAGEHTHPPSTDRIGEAIGDGNGRDSVTPRHGSMTDPLHEDGQPLGGDDGVPPPSNLRTDRIGDADGRREYLAGVDHAKLSIGVGLAHRPAEHGELLMHQDRNVDPDIVGGTDRLPFIERETFHEVAVQPTEAEAILTEPDLVARIMKPGATLAVHTEPNPAWLRTDQPLITARLRAVGLEPTFTESGITAVKPGGDPPTLAPHDPAAIAGSDRPATVHTPAVEPPAGPATHAAGMGTEPHPNSGQPNEQPGEGIPDGDAPDHPAASPTPISPEFGAADRRVEIAKAWQAAETERGRRLTARDQAAQRLGLDPEKTTTDLLRDARAAGPPTDPVRAAAIKDLERYRHTTEMTKWLDGIAHQHTITTLKRIRAEEILRNLPNTDTLYGQNTIGRRAVHVTEAARLERILLAGLADPIVAGDDPVPTTVPYHPWAATVRTLKNLYGHDVLPTPDIAATPHTDTDPTFTTGIQLQRLPSHDNLIPFLQSMGGDSSVVVLDAGEPAYILHNHNNWIMKLAPPDGEPFGPVTPTELPSSARGIFIDEYGVPTVPEGLERLLTAHGAAHPFRILDDPGLSGDGEVAPGVWGKYGAAGIIIRHIDPHDIERFLLVKSAPGYAQGNWQLPGGALNSKERPAEGAARELHEETGAHQEYLDTLSHSGTHVVHGPKGWKYTTLAADAPTRFDPVVDGIEIRAARWVTRDELATLTTNGQVHSALTRTLPDILATFEPAATLRAYQQLPEALPELGLHTYRPDERRVHELVLKHPELQNAAVPGLVAVRSYTRGAYHGAMNAAMRSGDPARIAPFQTIIDATTGGLRQMPAFVGAVSRGISVPAEDLPGVLARYADGEVVTERAFTSSDIDKAFSGNIRFDIYSRTGRALKMLSTIPDENEVLFLPGTTFRSTGPSQDKKGKWVIGLIEMEK